ncbi:MAG: glycosyltransferase family 2 protein, partial [Bryobacteraceae bacterium]
MYARVKRLPVPKRLCKNRWNNVLRISLIICTYNRAEILPRCLLAARNQSLNPREYEIIVVDNGSADDTAAVVRPF